MSWIDQMLEEAHRSRQHVNLDPEAIPVPVRLPTPVPVPRHSLLGWSIVLLSLSIIGLAAWFLNGVRIDW